MRSRRRYRAPRWPRSGPDSRGAPPCHVWAGRGARPVREARHGRLPGKCVIRPCCKLRVKPRAIVHGLIALAENRSALASALDGRLPAPFLARYSGRLVKLTGDGALVEFISA